MWKQSRDAFRIAVAGVRRIGVGMRESRSQALHDTRVRRCRVPVHPNPLGGRSRIPFRRSLRPPSNQEVLMFTRTRAVALAGVVGIVASLALATPAVAADGSNCWGVVSAQAARSDGGLGAHSSSFDEPRLGLGNV